MRPSQNRDRTLGSNDSNLRDRRTGQTASKARSRWRVCCTNSWPPRDDTQRGDREIGSSAWSDLSLANAKTTKRAGVARGTPSPTKGTHCRFADLDAASDCKGDAPRHGDCVSREGARYIPGDCRRTWAITATGAANRFQKLRLRNVIRRLRRFTFNTGSIWTSPARLERARKRHRIGLTSNWPLSHAP